MSGDSVGESMDGLVKRRRDGFNGQPLESSNQRVRKAMQAVTVGNDAFALHVIQDLANLYRRVFLMIQKRYEAGDGALEVDVVFPKRVVCVDEQSLSAVGIRISELHAEIS